MTRINPFVGDTIIAYLDAYWLRMDSADDLSVLHSYETYVDGLITGLSFVCRDETFIKSLWSKHHECVDRNLDRIFKIITE